MYHCIWAHRFTQFYWPRKRGKVLCRFTDFHILTLPWILPTALGMIKVKVYWQLMQWWKLCSKEVLLKVKATKIVSNYDCFVLHLLSLDDADAMFSDTVRSALDGCAFKPILPAQLMTSRADIIYSGDEMKN